MFILHTLHELVLWAFILAFVGIPLLARNTVGYDLPLWVGIPIFLTMLRIATGITLFFFRGTVDLAFMVFIGIIFLTDCIDGQIARRTGQETPLGKILDPVADHLLTYGLMVFYLTGHFSQLISLSIYGFVPLTALFIIPCLPAAGNLLQVIVSIPFLLKTEMEGNEQFLTMVESNVFGRPRMALGSAVLYLTGIYMVFGLTPAGLIIGIFLMTAGGIYLVFAFRAIARYIQNLASATKPN